MEFKSRITEIIKRTPDVYSFRFEKPEKSDYIAGQWFFLSLKVNGEYISKPFSFTSSPDEPFLEFTKRITGSDFSKKLMGSVPGDIFDVKMPFGNFTLSRSGRKIAFLIGGIGITPAISMCKHVKASGIDKDIFLFYGNANEEDIAFRHELDSISSVVPHMKIIYTLTCADAPSNGWKGGCGFIDDKMIKKELSDIQQRTFYVCGPPYMVTCLVDTLKQELMVPDEKIILEKFAGY